MPVLFVIGLVVLYFVVDYFVDFFRWRRDMEQHWAKRAAQQADEEAWAKEKAGGVNLPLSPAQRRHVQELAARYEQEEAAELEIKNRDEPS